MKTKKSLADSMATIINAINGVLNNSEILLLMEQFGYTKERIEKQGILLYNNTMELMISQKKEYGEQYTASTQVNNLWNVAYSDYMTTLRLCRIALKNKPGALHSIAATGTRKRSLTGFIDNARMLYNNLLTQTKYMDAVTSFGITNTKLDKGLSQIDELEGAYQDFLKEKGEAQNNTVLRDNAFDELYDWYSDFRATARIALQNEPQLLEKLGIVIKRQITR